MNSSENPCRQKLHFIYQLLFSHLLVLAGTRRKAHIWPWMCSLMVSLVQGAPVWSASTALGLKPPSFSDSQSHTCHLHKNGFICFSMNQSMVHQKVISNMFLWVKSLQLTWVQSCVPLHSDSSARKCVRKLKTSSRLTALWWKKQFRNHCNNCRYLKLLF